MEGFVRKILNSSAVDGPGNRMVIFLQGCNLNCTYCHNPETIEIIKEAHDPIQIMDPKDILERVLKVKPFISGVTFSGGECTLQYDFLLEVCNLLHQNNISILIDTNGTINPTKLETLSAYVDGFMLDVKAFSSSTHHALTGQNNENILLNFDNLARLHKLYEVRTVIVPDIVDNEATIDHVCRILKKHASHSRYKIIKYRNYGVRKPYNNSYRTPSDEEMEVYKSRILTQGIKTVIIT